MKTRLMAITRERDTQVRGMRELQETLHELKSAGAKTEEDLNNDELEAMQVPGGLRCEVVVRVGHRPRIWFSVCRQI